MQNIFSISKADHPIPLIFDSPHSGHIYPDDFNHACPLDDLRRSEDMYVEELFAGTPAYGAAFLQAHFPRSYIDVNRAVDDIDPKLLAEPWPVGEINPTSRSDAGIGLIRRLIKPGVSVYNRPLKAAEIIQRIETYYTPYHKALEKLLDEAYENFGQVWHINCHSMPASTALPRRPIGMLGQKPKTADFVLGNRDNTTCDMNFMHAIQSFLRGRGYTVTINDPFKGVELVERYSSPARNRHSLQIEINKKLYMDEQTFEKTKTYTKLAEDVDALIAFCATYVESQLTALAAD